MTTSHDPSQPTGPATLHFQEDGPPDAPVLVLGPSLGTDLGLFDAQVPALAEHHRVIRYDLRGHGGSPVVDGPYTVADLADDVRNLLDELGIDRFAYAGVSLGGAVGLQLAVTLRERVNRLIVMASAARFPDPPSWKQRAERVRAEGTEFLVPSRIGAWVTPKFAETHPDETERLLQMLRSTSREGYAACCETIEPFDLSDRLGEITAPTLVIAGADDPATPPDTVRTVADGIPDARFVVVPQASHLVSAEQPEAVTAEIRRFLA
ncbi:MAG: 3-oxoadipate enol-lactonase [Blastococcus sp.]|nr:3-oxoadipate enol-lactonase [Blastococcus sp.]